ncbi:hypothetical protein HanRHA438_Chr09g0422201 [Helianthus annuus]|nr:hypothetical protein HanRHA438_Chr09g0422201 [Helianthus annuus]
MLYAYDDCLPRRFYLFPKIHSFICVQLFLPCKRSDDEPSVVLPVGKVALEY